MTTKYKTAAQQDLEARHSGHPLKEILIDEFTRLSGRPMLVAQVAVALQISEPTIRQWCRDLGIDIHAYKAPDVDSN